jgi:membrane protease subunit (stomatin/prohibitin family)
MKEVVGTDGHFTTDEIEGQLRSILVSSFTGMLGQAKIAALDLAANYRSLGDSSRQDMDGQFQRYGLSLTQFVIENISVPPEVEKMLDTRAQMGIVGDMGRYTQFQTAQAIPAAAQAGGGAGDFMGMGAGIAMGQQMAGAMASAFSQPQQTPQQQQGAAAPAQPQSGAAAGSRFCTACGQAVPGGAKFCPECGSRQESGCPNCGSPTTPGAKFCPECGNKLA